MPVSASLPIAQAVDETVVQAAKTGAGVESDEGNVERPQRFGHDVAAEYPAVRRRWRRPFQLRIRPSRAVAIRHSLRSSQSRRLLHVCPNLAHVKPRTSIADWREDSFPARSAGLVTTGAALARSQERRRIQFIERERQA